MAGDDLDLTRERVEAGDLASPKTSAPYDPSRHRELLRGAIALSLILLLWLVVLAPFKLLLGPDKLEFASVKELLGRLLSPVVGLVGSAIGFYFGGRSDSRAGAP